MNFVIGRREIEDILTATLALSLAFMFAFFCNIISGNFICFKNPINLIFYFIIALLGVITAFIGHEMMHKYVALKNGYYAEFRKWNTGLIISIITGMIGIVFALPGATMIYGYLDRKTNGIVSISGPVYNMIIGIIFIVISFISNISEILFFLGSINIWLSTFNMLPIPPLDGSKVLRWNPVIWGIVFIISLILTIKFVFFL